MKLANNLLSATAMAATSEAMVMGVKAGLDPRIMLDVINAGSGRNTATEHKFPKLVVPRTFDLGFTNGLMMKDVKLALSEAQALGVPMEVTQAVAHDCRLRRDRAGQDLTTGAAARAPRRGGASPSAWALRALSVGVQPAAPIARATRVNALAHPTGAVQWREP